MVVRFVYEKPVFYCMIFTYTDSLIYTDIIYIMNESFLLTNRLVEEVSEWKLYQQS